MVKDCCPDLDCQVFSTDVIHDCSAVAADFSKDLRGLGRVLVAQSKHPNQSYMPKTQPSLQPRQKKIRVLVVCVWPVGGIRNYLRYVFTRFNQEEFDVTVIARSSHERGALESDFSRSSTKLHWLEANATPFMFTYRVALEVLRLKPHVINSQGFLSALHVSVVNRFIRKPHILTLHGILERKYLGGLFGPIRRRVLGSVLRDVSVFHGVGADVLAHVKEHSPRSARETARWIVIQNGIDTHHFLESSPESGEGVRNSLGIRHNVFIFGFFGRFMPQKGFDLIIDSVALLRKCHCARQFIVLAVGSGDYERETKAAIDRSSLSQYFHFLPYVADIRDLMQGCDAILMPSRWEAFGLLAAECLCSGVPLIASTCMGLREVIADSPCTAIPPEDATALAKAMEKVMDDPSLKDLTRSYRPAAAMRFDVGNTVAGLSQLFRDCARP